MAQEDDGLEMEACIPSVVEMALEETRVSPQSQPGLIKCLGLPNHSTLDHSDRGRTIPMRHTPHSSTLDSIPNLRYMLFVAPNACPDRMEKIEICHNSNVPSNPDHRPKIVVYQ